MAPILLTYFKGNDQTDEAVACLSYTGREEVMCEHDAQPPTAPTILVVEDDDATRGFYEDLLMMEGYRVVSAATGQSALARMAAHPIDAIVLDYRLPDTTGEEVCRQMRTIVASKVPILMVTADQSPGLEDQARAAGATAFLAKPFDPDDLLGWIAALIPPSARVA
jgi:CheY-like chemotaxis protein